MNRDFFDSNGNVIANLVDGTDEQWDKFFEVVRENINFKEMPFGDQVILDLQFFSAKESKIMPVWMILSFVNPKGATGKFKEFEGKEQITFSLPPIYKVTSGLEVPIPTDLIEDFKPTEENDGD